MSNPKRKFAHEVTTAPLSFAEKVIQHVLKSGFFANIIWLNKINCFRKRCLLLTANILPFAAFYYKP